MKDPPNAPGSLAGQIKRIRQAKMQLGKGYSMENRHITPEVLNSFCKYLEETEHSAATIEKYCRDVA